MMLKIAEDLLTNHDRTIVTVVVLIVGTLLIYKYGDQVQVMVLVSSAWTLALTFWFRTTVSDQNGKQ